MEILKNYEKSDSENFPTKCDEKINPLLSSFYINPSMLLFKRTLSLYRMINHHLRESDSLPARHS